MPATPSIRRTAEERDALSAAAQRRAWARDPFRRRRALAIGHVRSVAACRPDDSSFVADVVAAIAEGQTAGRAVAEVPS